MKKLTLAVMATLTLAVVSCKKTEQPKTVPNLQGVMKPSYDQIRGYKVQTVKATPHFHEVVSFAHDYHGEIISVFDGCSGNAGSCITRFDVVVNIPVPTGIDDTTNIKLHDYAAIGSDFSGGLAWEHGDTTMLVYKYGVSNVDEYFANPSAIVMNAIPLDHPDGKYMIKAATRPGRLLHLSDGYYLEILLNNKTDFEDARW